MATTPNTTKQPLGRKQQGILRELHDRGYWSAGCGWHFGTPSNTARILDSLVARGLVTRAEEATGWTGVAATIYGRTRIAYRPAVGKGNG